jgi:hypothetical protein
VTTGKSTPETPSDSPKTSSVELSWVDRKDFIDFNKVRFFGSGWAGGV